MRHLSVAEYGQFLGCTGDRLQVKHKDEVILETPLSRLRSITIAKEGVGLSSNLLLACASRGIRLYVLDWRGIAVAALSGKHQHAIAAIRAAQFKCMNSPVAATLSAETVITKLRNQRAVLLYFSKYLAKNNEHYLGELRQSAAGLDELCRSVVAIQWQRREQWRDQLMGYEGTGAAACWKVLRTTELAPPSFEKRDGRGSKEIFNQALNYGYTLLMSYVWSALDNAGFELYSGFFHQERAGKPSLVLDVMEEYRPWVVDRTIIAMRAVLAKEKSLDAKLKRRISNEIHATMAKRYPYKGKRLRLESILQRQVYQLAGCVMDQKKYKGYRFKW